MKYHSHYQLLSDLQEIHKLAPDMTELFTLGKSVKNRDLTGIRLGLRHHIDSEAKDDELKPLVKLVKNQYKKKIQIVVCTIFYR